MRSESIQQFAIVKEDSAAAFEGALNARIRELSHEKPVVLFSESDPFLARIQYSELVRVPETKSDEFSLKGMTFHCSDCPEFCPIVKADGTEDRRLSYGECQYAHLGRTYKDSEACDLLFEMIRNGRIGLCYKR